MTGADGQERIDPQHATLDELRMMLAPRIAANAVFDGWGDRALADAAGSLGVPADRARLCFPDGPTGMVDSWFESIDGELGLRLYDRPLAAMKIRERIRLIVETRLDIARPQREAVRRALAILALPTNVTRSLKISWRSADRMWRLAGDASTDFSHYTRRATLAAVYTATLMVWINDETPGDADTREFLDRRIDDVIRFERAKAQLKGDPQNRFSVTRFLGRLRYPET